LACDFLPPPARACLFPFEQFIRQQIVQLQDSILERLHHHTLSNIFFDGTSKAHHAQILSCFSVRTSAWLTFQLIFPAFRLFSLIFCITFCTRLGLPCPSIISISQCVCTHPIDPLGIHLLCCVHGNEHIGTHNVIRDTFAAIARDASLISHETKTITCASFNHIQLLSSMSRHYAYQRCQSHFNQCCHC